MVPFDENVTAADLKGVSIMDYDKDSKMIKAIETFVSGLN